MPKKISHKQKSRKHSGRRTKKYNRKQKGGKPSLRAVAAALSGFISKKKAKKPENTYIPLTTPGASSTNNSRPYTIVDGFRVPIENPLYAPLTSPPKSPTKSPTRTTRHSEETKHPIQVNAQSTQPNQAEALKTKYKQLMSEINAREIVERYQINRQNQNPENAKLKQSRIANLKKLLFKKKNNLEMHALNLGINITNNSKSSRPRMPLPGELKKNPYVPQNTNANYISVAPGAAPGNPLYVNVPLSGIAPGNPLYGNVLHSKEAQGESPYVNVPNPIAAPIVNLEVSQYKPYLRPALAESPYGNVPNSGAAQGKSLYNTVYYVKPEESPYKPYPGAASKESPYNTVDPPPIRNDLSVYSTLKREPSKTGTLKLLTPTVYNTFRRPSLTRKVSVSKSQQSQQPHKLTTTTSLFQTSPPPRPRPPRKGSVHRNPHL